MSYYQVLLVGLESQSDIQQERRFSLVVGLRCSEVFGEHRVNHQETLTMSFLVIYDRGCQRWYQSIVVQCQNETCFKYFSNQKFIVMIIRICWFVSSFRNRQNWVETYYDLSLRYHRDRHAVMKIIYRFQSHHHLQTLHCHLFRHHFEIRRAAKLYHLNVVAIKGFCYDHEHRFVVKEFIASGQLD